MGLPGYTETEKIKILYEESLRDIQQLTARLEKVSSKIESSASTAHEVEKLSQSAILQASQTFKKLADDEMRLAGKTVIASLSEEVAQIAQRISSDATVTQRYYARNKAVAFVAALILICTFIFTGAGFYFAKLSIGFRIKDAEEALAQNNVLLQNANKITDEKIAALEKKSAAEIAKIRAENAWVASPTGQLAKKFFDLGDGVHAARCTGHNDNWKIHKDNDNVARCVPNRREFFGGDKKLYGWKIP